MNKNAPIYFGLFALSAFVLFSIYRNVKKTFDDLQYKFTGLKFDLTKSLSTGLSKLFFSINLVLTNTHFSNIVIHAIDFDVYYNNAKIANIVNDVDITIAPKQTTVNLLKIDVVTQNLPGAVANALQNLANKNFNFTFTFEGNITTSIGSFPIKQNLNIGS